MVIKIKMLSAAGTRVYTAFDGQRFKMSTENTQNVSLVPRAVSGAA